jgi:hypothetical protein
LAEDPDAIREAIGETRTDIAETIDALSSKADVKARAAEKVSKGKEQAKAKASEMTHLADQAVPPQARPAVESAIGTSRSAAGRVESFARQRPGAAVAAGGALVLMMVVRRRRRRKR